ncbi:cation diffusion facilitator family transporter [Vallitalea pronyensis]|nr:cation diffusion facilitator family transporter [Vallitalea pronyensis]
MKACQKHALKTYKSNLGLQVFVVVEALMDNVLKRGYEARKVTRIGLVINVLIACMKLLAGFFGKSSAMIADGVHSLSDFFSDIIVIAGLRLTDKPEDACHNYGHGKIETLVTVFISCLLMIAGFYIMESGISKMIGVIQGQELLRPGWIAFFAAIFSIVSKEGLYVYTIRAGRRINSPVLIANAWHHRSDSLSSIGTLIGIGGAILLGNKWVILDPIASVVVSLFIFKVGYDIIKPAINELLECSLNNEEINQIKDILDRYSEVKSYHKLRTRRIGRKIAIDVHTLLDKRLNIVEAHDIANLIENDIRALFGDISIINIHIEPFL